MYISKGIKREIIRDIFRLEASKAAMNYYFDYLIICQLFCHFIFLSKKK